MEEERLLTQVRFDSLPIHDLVLKGIKDAGFDYCTQIQSETLPLSLAGKDVAGQAQTGTGKTAAFLISLFTHLLNHPPPKSNNSRRIAPRGFIIAPTRELARQIEKDALVLGKYCDFKIVCVYGGIDYEKQRKKIQEGVDILIVTPGRLIDYYKQKLFSLKSVQALVIDEADRMFDMGFISDLRYILRNTSPYHKRLSMMFSATLGFRAMELCYEFMNNAEKVEIKPEKLVVDEVDQSLYHIAEHEKFNLLLGLLQKEAGEKIIIFCNTKRTAEDLDSLLRYNGYNAGQISGDLHQSKRIKVLENFAQGELDILIGTDVASRGLHIDNITDVINYELPQDPEDYVHRIGRTARAGAMGRAISLVCENYVQHLEKIETILKHKIPIVWPEENMFVQGREGKPPRRPRSSPKGSQRSRPSGSRRSGSRSTGSRSSGRQRPRGRRTSKAT